MEDFHIYTIEFNPKLHGALYVSKNDDSRFFPENSCLCDAFFLIASVPFSQHSAPQFFSHIFQTRFILASNESLVFPIPKEFALKTINDLFTYKFSDVHKLDFNTFISLHNFKLESRYHVPSPN